jgi:hypothetical protein
MDSLRLAINSYAEEFDETPKLESIADKLGVHRSTILHKFGQWPSILQDLGLTPVPLGRRYNDEECFENIVQLWTHYGRQPNFRELNSPPSKVGFKRMCVVGVGGVPL